MPDSSRALSHPHVFVFGRICRDFSTSLPPEIIRSGYRNSSSVGAVWGLSIISKSHLPSRPGVQV